MTEKIFINKQELENIYSKIQALDKKCQELEKANQRIIITGAKFHPQPKPINISEEKLINIYNYTPQLLAEYATAVSITAETYRNKTQENVYLDYTNNGYYWVILREEKSQKFYYLVPNGIRNLNFYRLQNQLELLFIIQGEKEFSNNNFVLEKVAYLEILSSGCLWQLKNRGVIKIGKVSPINKLLNDLEKIHDQEGNIPENITNLLSILNEDHQSLAHVKDKQKDLEKYVLETLDNLLALKSNLTDNIDELEVSLNNKIETKETSLFNNINALSSNIEMFKNVTNNQFITILRSLKMQDYKINEMGEQLKIKINRENKRINVLNVYIFILFIIMSLTGYRLYNIGLFANFFEPINSTEKVEKEEEVGQYSNESNAIKMEEKVIENDNVINSNNNQNSLYNNRQSPVDFIEQHYQTLNARDYPNTWNNLSDNFLNTRNSSYEDYQQWWDSVETINIANISLIAEENNYAKLKVKLIYQMKNGKIIEDNKPYIYLKFDYNQNQWLIDKKSSY